MKEYHVVQVPTGLGVVNGYKGACIGTYEDKGVAYEKAFTQLKESNAGPAYLSIEVVETNYEAVSET